MTAKDFGEAEHEAGADAPVQLLEILVRTDAESVAAFKRAAGACAAKGAWGDAASGAAAEPAVPLTYPFCWLSMQEVRPTLERMIGRPAYLPVHEAQNFDYERPLALGADYRLAFSFRRANEPRRLIVNVKISTLQGQSCARFETILRLVPTGAHD
jgi:hypothetical protein